MKRVLVLNQSFIQSVVTIWLAHCQSIIAHGAVTLSSRKQVRFEWRLIKFVLWVIVWWCIGKTVPYHQGRNKKCAVTPTSRNELIQIIIIMICLLKEIYIYSNLASRGWIAFKITEHKTIIIYTVFKTTEKH